MVEQTRKIKRNQLLQSHSSHRFVIFLVTAVRHTRTSVIVFLIRFIATRQRIVWSNRPCHRVGAFRLVCVGSTVSHIEYVRRSQFRSNLWRWIQLGCRANPWRQWRSEHGANEHEQKHENDVRRNNRRAANPLHSRYTSGWFAGTCLLSAVRSRSPPNAGGIVWSADDLGQKTHCHRRFVYHAFLICDGSGFPTPCTCYRCINKRVVWYPEVLTFALRVFCA